MNTKAHSLSLAALALLGAAAIARAQTVFHVATAQDLQNALTLAAANGANNVIYLTNGYYTGNFNFNSSGGYNLLIANEPNVTNNTQIVLDGGNLGRDISLSNVADGGFTVQGVTFLRDCGSASIGALRIAAGNGATLLVQNCQFLSPSNASGVGLEIDSGLNVTISNCVVTGFTMGPRGGQYGDGMDISSVSGNVTIQNCTVTSNSYNGFYVNSSSGYVLVTNSTFTGNSGSGVNCSGSTVTLSGNVFNGNSGGGASCGGTTIQLIANTFVGNSTGSFGGGGAYCSGTTITLFKNTFSGNSSPGNAPGAGYLYGGGAASCTGSNVLVVDNVFFNNNCSYGGAIFFAASGSTYQEVYVSGNDFLGNSAPGGNGGAFLSYGEPINEGPESPYVAIVTNNSFEGNSSGNTGGAAYLSDASTGYLTISANVFNQNSSGTGGGIYATGPNLTLQDNLLVSNSQTSASSQGGGVWVDATSDLFMINNTIFGNTAAGSGGGAAFEVTGTVELLNVYNNIIWGNSASGNGADVWLAGTGQKKVFEFNDVNNMYGVWDIALNNINVSPQFFNPVGGDYHYPEASPCANAGTNGAPSQPLTDLDGNLRTNSLGQIDLGCYEFNTTATHPADTNATFVITPGEFTAYAAAWKAGQSWTNAPASAPNPIPIPANYLTRAGYIMTNGGAYTNDGSARPTNWKTNQ